MVGFWVMINIIEIAFSSMKGYNQNIKGLIYVG